MAWTCKTAYWDSSGAGAHSTLTAEPWFLTFTMHHQFNKPALTIVIFDDRAGQATQKYKVDAGSNLAYLGSGRIQILENSTVVFDGRIMEGHTDHESGTYRLLCKDWLSQLADELIHFDTRGDLNGSGLRESTVHTDINGQKFPVHTSGTDYYMVDDAMSWTTNEWDGYRLIFPHKMAGENEYWAGPYDEIVSATLSMDAPADGETAVWTATGTPPHGYHGMGDNTKGWTVSYYFTSPEEGDPFVSCSQVQLEIYYWVNTVVTEGCTVYFYEHNTPGWKELGTLPPVPTGEYHRAVFTIPEGWVPYLWTPSTGYIACRITVPDKSPSYASIFVYRIRFYYKVTMQGDDSAYEILSNTADTLKVDTDLTYNGVGIWEGCPYSICDSVVTHATTLVQSHDPLVPLTISTGTPTHFYVARHFTEMSPIKILLELAKTTGAVFYADPSDWDSIKWVSTWTPSSPPSLTDSDVLSWETSREWMNFYNEYHIYGIRLTDEQLYINTANLATDPGADSKSLFGVTKAQLLTSPAIYTVQDAEEVGGKMVERDEDIQFILTARFPGLSTLRLGDDVAVTSTYLGLSAVNYWVIDFHFDLARFETKLILHPDTTQDQFTRPVLFNEYLRKATEMSAEADRKADLSPSWKDVWT